MTDIQYNKERKVTIRLSEPERLKLTKISQYEGKKMSETIRLLITMRYKELIELKHLNN